MTEYQDSDHQDVSKPLAKKLHIKTYGCQMNVYDSQRIADVLAPMGYELSETIDDADMIVLNTCHIREKAAEKVYSELGRIKPLKKRKEKPVLAVGGCVAQAEGGEIFNRAPYVDVVFGPQTYHRLPEMLARAARDNGHVLDVDFPPDSKFDALPAPSSRQGYSAFLSVQEGCDKFCTFCVVPYTRGAEFSRPVSEILKEAQGLVQNGVREITLLGQNVNAYHGEAADGREWGLGRLIYALAEIGGLERIRYTTSHPRDMDDELIAAHGAVPQLMPFLHLPVQSGSDHMLKAMNRGHGRDDYRRIVEKLRAARADIALSSDFIVGFPGESDADFDATMSLVDEVGFIQAYSFKYSARPGTPASVMDSQIPDRMASARLSALQALLNDQQRRFNDDCVGRTVDVLFERPGRHEAQITGRSPYMQPVHVRGQDELMGEIHDVKITATEANSLFGERVPETAGAAPQPQWRAAQ